MPRGLASLRDQYCKPKASLKLCHGKPSFRMPGMPERVLITGGAGFIGAHTAILLLERGYQVRALDWLRPPVHQSGERPPWVDSSVELLVGDIRDKVAVAKALRGVSAVIHLAAYQDYLPDFSAFFHTNTVGTALLYEVIVEEKLDVRKIVIASSQAVYGEGRHFCAEHGDVFPDLRTEHQLLRGDWDVRCPQCDRVPEVQLTNEERSNPQNQYGLSKLTQELVGLSLGRRYAIPTTCLRYSITQGRWQSPRNAYSGICRIFVLRARAGKECIIFEDGAAMRDYVYVGDVAVANLLALEDIRTDYQVYNVGGERALSSLEYARIVNEVTGSRLEPQLPGYYRFGDTRHVVSDVSQLRRLGWKTTLTVAEIVADYANWVAETGITDQSTDSGIKRMLELGTLRRATR